MDILSAFRLRPVDVFMIAEGGFLSFRASVYRAENVENATR